METRRAPLLRLLLLLLLFLLMKMVITSLSLEGTGCDHVSFRVQGHSSSDVVALTSRIR